MTTSSPYYITTAIDYPNAHPHVGHIYEKIIADLYARWHRISGYKVYFMTGTDENGQKLQKSSAKHHLNTADFIAYFSDSFRTTCKIFDISHTRFIRTTEAAHHHAVNFFWDKLSKNGYIYSGDYEGHYCYGCEQFYPENQAVNELCPVHGTPLHMLKESGYFFRLSHFQNKVIQHIEDNPQFIYPHAARDEMLSRLRREPLRDLSITRKNSGWGIPVPKKNEYVIYTWFDALINYYTPIHTQEFPQNAWPCNLHVIGKDITWFHTVIWPAMLMAIDIPLPKTVYVHGMVLDGQGQKMSKTRGNVITPQKLLQYFDLDSIRYFFIRSIPSGSDGKLSFDQMKSKHNNELSNEWGNLVSRVIKLTIKRCGQHISAPISWTDSNAENNLIKDKHDLYTKTQNFMHRFEHHKAMDALFAEISQINAHINEQKPWSIEDADALYQVLYTFIYRISVLCALLTAFLPDSSKSIWENVLKIHFNSDHPLSQSEFLQSKNIQKLPKFTLQASSAIIFKKIMTENFDLTLKS